MNLFDIFEGAIDDLEARRIEDLEAKMDDLTARAKATSDPRVKEALRHEFAKAKAERDSYYKVNVEEAPGAETLAHNQATDASNLKALGLAEEYQDTNYTYTVYIDGNAIGTYGSKEEAKAVVRKKKEVAPGRDYRIKPKSRTSAASIRRFNKNRDRDLDEHGGGGGGPAQWHSYVRSHRANEGWKGGVAGGVAGAAGGEILGTKAGEALGKAIGKQLGASAVPAPLSSLGSKAGETIGSVVGSKLGAVVGSLAGGAGGAAIGNKIGDEIDEHGGGVNSLKNYISWRKSANKERGITKKQPVGKPSSGGVPKKVPKGSVHGKLDTSRGVVPSASFSEGWQDFNKVEPYAVCLAGKPVKKFDYYEEARKFHDNWKKKLYREGNTEKADKITLMPLNLDEASSPAQQAAIAINMKKHHQKPKHMDEDIGSWIVFDPVTKQIKKRFKTHTAGKSYAQTHNLGFASSEYYFDNIKEGLKDPKDNPCWKGYHPVGTKEKDGRTVPNCVPKESVEEDYNGEYDDEAGMAHGNLYTILKAAEGLMSTIGDHDNLPEWVQEKIAKVEGMLVTVWNYLQSQKAQGIDPQIYESYYKLVEDWQKANKKDKTDGMSKKAVKAYRREHPGSKLQTAVTTKPSKLKKGSKASKRRKSYCSRSKGQMKMHNISCQKTPDKAICKARRRWNCESQEQFDAMLEASMAWASHKPTGPKFSGYLKGTDPAPTEFDNKSFGAESAENPLGHKELEYLIAKAKQSHHKPDPALHKGDEHEINGDDQKVGEGIDGNMTVKSAPITKPLRTRNFVAKNAIQSGAGKHANQLKKAAAAGRHAKHKGRLELDEISDEEGAKLRKDAEDYAIKQMTASKKAEPKKSFMKQVGDKQIGMVKGAYKGLTGQLEESDNFLTWAVRNGYNLTKPAVYESAKKEYQALLEDCGPYAPHETYYGAMDESLKKGEYYVWTVYFDDGTSKRIKVTSDEFDPYEYYAKQDKTVVNVDYNWEIQSQ